ncbi:hypothetical protein J3R82DRAFT_63 [Butyriboletus roseoflavus]|nr:hypothetical protein J3R82DRAFT_63 [Butyriboletus roseoflavus]
MRRAQSVRTYPRSSLNLTTTLDPADLTALRETDETVPIEDTLRKQLLEKDRENDKVRASNPPSSPSKPNSPPVPPLETIQSLEKEYKNLDLILQGTQRENERCMAELERVRTRERLLEQALAKLAGENWQTVLDIGPPSATFGARAMGTSLLNRAMATPPLSSEASNSSPAASQDSIRGHAISDRANPSAGAWDGTAHARSRGKADENG